MIRLHHCHQTRSMRTLWLLLELGIDFEVEIHGFGPELRDPSYLALNPVGRVPSIEMDGRVFSETGAIAEILCEKYPEAGLGRTIGSPGREDFLVWLHFAETMSAHSQILTQQHIMLFEDHMRSPVVMKIEAKRMAKTFEAVERRLSSGPKYLADDQFSAADIAVGQAVYMSRHFAKIEPFENLTRWYGQITERPAFVGSLPPAGADLLYGRDFYEPWNG